MLLCCYFQNTLGIVDPSLASLHGLFALGFPGASLKLELELRPLLGPMFLVYPSSW